MHFAHLTNTLLKDEESEYFLNRFRFDRIVVMSLWLTFLAHPLYVRRIALGIKNPTATCMLLHYHAKLKKKKSN